MSDLTVADELAFAALPDETRTLCEKIIDARVEEVADRAVRAALESEAIANTWQDGYNAGQAAERRKAQEPKPAPTLDASQLAARPKGNGEAAD